jgi:glycosyltransferase involved in cell wall biosynthesis
MACGAPVIVSSTTAAGEIAGDAALAVSPYEPAAIAAALDNVLQQPALRDQLIERGEQHRRQFTWERAAEQTLALYERVFAQRKRKG